jgi:hypothetical protein
MKILIGNKKIVPHPPEKSNGEVKTSKQISSPPVAEA